MKTKKGKLNLSNAYGNFNPACFNCGWCAATPGVPDFEFLIAMCFGYE